MTYHMLAAQEYAEHRFPQGLTTSDTAKAPAIIFNRLESEIRSAGQADPAVDWRGEEVAEEIDPGCGMQNHKPFPCLPFKSLETTYPYF